MDVSAIELSAEKIGEDNGNNLPKTSIYTKIGSNLPNLYYRINYGENCTRDLSANKTTNYHSTYRSDVIRKIGSVCKLYNEFESGTRRLHHQELFGIATNIVQVESGEKSFKTTLREYSYYNDESRYNKWNQDFRHIKGYKPYGCAGFCPYANTCPHSTNILSTVKPRFHQMEHIVNYVENFVSLDEAVEDFNKLFRQAVMSNKKGWHIIKAQTALGKTKAIIDLLKDTSLRILIAVPTNILKREICEKRALPEGIDIMASPSIHEIKPLLSRQVWDEIETLLNVY